MASIASASGRGPSLLVSPVINASHDDGSGSHTHHQGMGAR